MGATIFINRQNNDPGCSCSTTNDCPSGLFCFGGKCLCKEGTSCSDNSDCGGQNTSCENGICVQKSRIIDKLFE